MEKQIFPELLDKSIKLLTELPGYGEKSAQRFLESLLNLPRSEALDIVTTLLQTLEKLHPCKECGLYTEETICTVCSDEGRDTSIICVVEESFDAFAIERTGKYTGLYHILGGRLSPLEGITAEDLNIESLLERIKKRDVKEVILATNPTVEGEATATYIYNFLKNQNVDISRIAYGLPFGAVLENADDFTIAKALEHKVKLI
ncbi:MAG: recombination protein RecR [Aquificae bacterium]|nr:recombination protein RecR [Aquificota bacterium]